MVTWQEDGSHDDGVDAVDLSDDVNSIKMLVDRREMLYRLRDLRTLTPTESKELTATLSVLAKEPPTVRVEPKWTDGKSLPSKGGTL